MLDNNKYEFSWSIWLYQATEGATLASGFRFIPRKTVAVATARRVFADNSWSSFGGEILILGASSLINGIAACMALSLLF